TGLSPGTTAITASLGPAAATAILTVASSASGPLTLSCAPSNGPAMIAITYTAICSTTGGLPPYSWSIANGSLPSRLSMSALSNSSIMIAGTPSIAGSYSYTVHVSDASAPAASASQPYVGKVSSPLLSISTRSLIFSAPSGAAARSQQIAVISNP